MSSTAAKFAVSGLGIFTILIFNAFFAAFVVYAIARRTLFAAMYRYLRRRHQEQQRQQQQVLERHRRLQQVRAAAENRRWRDVVAEQGRRINMAIQVHELPAPVRRAAGQRLPAGRDTIEELFAQLRKRDE